MALAGTGDIVSAIGTYAEVITGLPATFDAAGYAALFAGTETELGLLEDFTMPVSTATVEIFNNMKTGKPIKVTTFVDAGDATLILGHVLTDDGQIIMNSHHNGADQGTPLSIKLNHSNGDTTYYSGKVSGYEPVKNPLNRVTYTVAVDESMVEVPAP